jgi:dienelactone hydrolase
LLEHPIDFWEREKLIMRNVLVFVFGLCVTFTAQAKLVKKDIQYRDSSQEFSGYIVYDDAKTGKLPGLLITHDWMGLTEKTKAQADRFAALGYVAFAMDVYGSGIRPDGADAAGKMAGRYKTDRPLLRKRMELALKALTGLPNVDSTRIAAAGYCFGGTSVIELARGGAALKAVVSFHGGLDSPEPKLGKNIKARVLALHGADDPFVPAAALGAFEDEMRAAHVDWQLVKFGNAVHSFTDKSAGSDNSKGAAYNAAADRRSFEMAKGFLAESLAP